MAEETSRAADDDKALKQLLKASSEATFILHGQGKVAMIPDKARQIFGLSEDAPFSALLEDPRNDALSEFIIDTVLQKKENSSGVLAFYPEGAEKPLMIEMKAIPLVDDETGERSGILVMVDDCTKREMLAKARREASFLTMAFYVYTCLFLFFWQAVVFFDLPLDRGNIADFGVGLALVLGIIALLKTSLREEIKKDFKVKRKTLLASAGFTVIFSTFVILARWLAGTNGTMSPMSVDWLGIFFSTRAWKYYASAIMQEILARGIMQDSMRLIFTGRYRSAMVIISSSLIFGVIHCPYGLLMMIGAGAFMGVLGIFYEKTRSILGTTVAHMVLGRLFMALFNF